MIDKKMVISRLGLIRIIFIVGGLLLAAFSFQRVSLIQSSRLWPTVDGKILSSALEERPVFLKGTFGKEYFARVWFVYQVEGKKYISCNLSFTQGFMRKPEAAEGIVQRYPAGKDVSVYYDPVNPEQAVVESSHVPLLDCALMGFGLFAVFTGVVAFFGALFRSPEDDTV